MKGRLFGYEGERFVAYWWFVGWWAISFGFHVSLLDRNMEIHLPFGFLRIGGRRTSRSQLMITITEVKAS